MPAKEWGSYRETLYRILDGFRPRYIFEYGTGKSTDIFCSYPDVEKVISVEHDDAYAENIRTRLYDNHTLLVEHDLDRYAGTLQDAPDFIFVDGRNRVECLKRAKQVSGAIVMLHDSDRTKYKEGIEIFSYKVYTDGGNTVTLTDDFAKASIIARVLKDDTIRVP